MSSFAFADSDDLRSNDFQTFVSTPPTTVRPRVPYQLHSKYDSLDRSDDGNYIIWQRHTAALFGDWYEITEWYQDGKK